MSTADHLIYWLLLACALPVNLYPITYAFRPWRSTRQGRALMVKALGNMIVIDVILAFQMFGDYPGRDVIRVTGFGLFCAGVWYLLVSLLTSPGARDYPPFRGASLLSVRVRLTARRTRAGSAQQPHSASPPVRSPWPWRR